MDLKAHLIPPWAGTPSIRPSCSSLALDGHKDGAATASPDIPSQGLPTLTAKNFFVPIQNPTELLMVPLAGAGLCPFYSCKSPNPCSTEGLGGVSSCTGMMSPHHPRAGQAQSLNQPHGWTLLPRCEITSHVTAQATAISQKT